MKQNHNTIPLLIDKQQANFTSDMAGLTLRQKELLRQLFSEGNIDRLTSIINGSSKQEWIDLSNNLLENEENISATIFIDGASELENSNAGIVEYFIKIKISPQNFILFQRILVRLQIMKLNIRLLLEPWIYLKN